MSNAIWVILQQCDGVLHRSSREVIAAGQALAQATGGRASAVLLGSNLGDLAAQVAGFGLDAVMTADHVNLAGYTPGAFIGALAPALRDASPAYVVAPHTYQSVDFVPRLAQTIDAALIPEVVAFTVADDGVVFQRPIMAGKLQSRVRARGVGTVVISVQSGAFRGDDAVAGQAEIRALTLDEAAVVADREILGVEQVGGDQVDLTKANAIVAVGRGVGGADKLAPLEALAASLGADLAASRPVIDNGWLPRDRQIGSSGQTVAPKLYIAAGISGAIQHLVGMKGSGCVVAINKDRSAPIFTVSQYGLVGDLHEIVPALTAAIEEAKA